MTQAGHQFTIDLACGEVCPLRQAARHAYPLIYEVENLMRRLFSQFMLTKIGKGWEKKALPENLKQEAAKKEEKKTPFIGVLHKVDFIHLKDFLFVPYPTRDQALLHQRLDEAQEIEDLDLTDLRQFVPRSNWDRYFVQYLPYESDALRDKWNRLYDLRCDVAHNAFLERRDFEEIAKLSAELTAKLREAIDRLPDVTVPESEKAALAESMSRQYIVSSTALAVLGGDWGSSLALDEFGRLAAEEIAKLFTVPAWQPPPGFDEALAEMRRQWAKLIGELSTELDQQWTRELNAALTGLLPQEEIQLLNERDLAKLGAALSIPLAFRSALSVDLGNADIDDSFPEQGASQGVSDRQPDDSDGTVRSQDNSSED